MDTTNTLTKTYQVANYHHVVLHAQHENHLRIIQGDREALTIQAPADVLLRTKAQVRNGVLDISLGGDWKERLRDALTTSLTRPEISYTLMVEKLKALEIYAMAVVKAESLKTTNLSIKFNGPGTLNIENLTAEKLNIELSGLSRAKIAGKVAEQSITIRGMAQYDGGALLSRHSGIEMTGAGIVTVWALDRLAVDVRGPGSVSYYGTQQILESLSPISSLTHLEKGKVIPEI